MSDGVREREKERERSTGLVCVCWYCGVSWLNERVSE